MISHKHKCIFIHIPKTGGKSIEKSLGVDLSKLHNSSTPLKERHGRPDEWMHPKYWDSYFTFTFVRNPWDRLVSSYYYIQKKSLRRDCPDWKLKRFLRRQKSPSINGFRHFVKKWIPNGFRYYEAWFDPQSLWMCADYDFVGRFENFQSDFDQVCEQLEIPQQKLPHLNKSINRTDYTEYYDDETREIAAKRYAKDIEYFGYQFGD